MRSPAKDTSIEAAVVGLLDTLREVASSLTAARESLDEALGYEQPPRRPELRLAKAVEDA